MNTDAPWPDLDEAESRVLKIQTKLHQWAADDPNRRFADLYNLVYDPAFLVVAWEPGQGQQGGTIRRCRWGEASLHRLRCDALLAGLRAELKARTFQPLPVRERLIPKATRQGPDARHPHRTGPGGPGRPEAGARADLRGGLPAV